MPSVKQASAHGGSTVTQKHLSQVFKIVISLPGGSRGSLAVGGRGGAGLGRRNPENFAKVSTIMELSQRGNGLWAYSFVGCWNSGFT